MTLSYKEAMEQAKAAIPSGSHVLCKPTYGNTFILPFKAGLTLMSCLENAEVYIYNYNKPPEIRGIRQEDMTISMLSISEYQQIRAAQLLGISVEELKKYTEQEEEIPF